MTDMNRSLMIALHGLVEFKDLSEDESYSAMDAIMSGQATDAQIAGFITALRMKGETAGEIAGCARVMREKAARIDPGPSPYEIVDTCGTGGDVKGTFNISTAAALITAGAGVKVAKHGNRSVSSRSGSADVLRELGVNIEADIPTVEKCLREVNFGFLFAPMLHSAMKYAIGPRREMAVRTVFNILGPLTNPAGAACQVLGVYEDKLVPLMASVLKKLGSKHAFVVHGADGLDEISLIGPTHVCELSDGGIREYKIKPQDFGMSSCAPEDIQVKSPGESAGAIHAVLDGAAGPMRDISVLNAAAAITASGAVEDMKLGVERAQSAIDSGRARRCLEDLIRITNE